ncbi:MAG: Trm112 family protein [Woeseiaceae bacterium]
MDKKLLSILCCPVTHKSLSLARKDLLGSVNAAIQAGELVNRDGAKLDHTLKEALVTDDGKTIYPVDDGIPVLIEGEAVALEQLEGR